MPVLNGDSRANRSRATATALDPSAAGAGRPEQTLSRCRAELHGERKMRGAAKSLHDQYDAYLDASEEHTFNKLHATLDKLERRAEREHTLYSGAAGWSTEHRNELADARSAPGGRRTRSPARFGAREQQRMGAGSSAGSSVASLMQQGEYVNGLPQESLSSYSERAPSPRGRPSSRAASPRRPASPMRQHPSVPPLGSDRSQADAASMSHRPGVADPTRCDQARRPSSPRGQRASSPRMQRPPEQRAASPRRQRPGQ